MFVLMRAFSFSTTCIESRRFKLHNITSLMGAGWACGYVCIADIITLYSSALTKSDC